MGGNPTFDAVFLGFNWVMISWSPCCLNWLNKLCLIGITEDPINLYQYQSILVFLSGLL